MYEDLHSIPFPRSNIKTEKGIYNLFVEEGGGQEKKEVPLSRRPRIRVEDSLRGHKTSEHTGREV